jgi:hypothetical protein
MTFITHGFRVSVVSDVRDLGSPLRFMLRRSSLVECVTRNVFTMRRKKIIHQYVQPCLSKNPKYTFYTIKSLLTLAYKKLQNGGEGVKFLFTLTLTSVWSMTLKINRRQPFIMINLYQVSMVRYSIFI